MRNEAARDAMIYPYLRNFLAYGNPGELIADMDNMYYNNRRVRKWLIDMIIQHKLSL